MGLFAGIPAAVFIGIIILMAFYLHFEKKILPQVEADLEERRASAAEQEPALVPAVAATTEPGEPISAPRV